MAYLLLVVGFVFLIKGADLFVDGSSSLARILKVPSIIVGLTLVSMGTSAPEAAVSITAGISGNNDISLGNIIGSNIFNLLFVIGCSALIFPVISPKDILRRDLWWNIGVTAVLFFMCCDFKLSRIEGFILFLGMIVYLAVIIRNAWNHRLEEKTDENILSVPKSLLCFVFGLTSIIIGGQLVVNNASTIAKALGMSDTLVGLTIVAVGTSLPELMTSVVAAQKGDSGIALGNAVGSCIFNILFILGVTTMLTPISVAGDLLIDTAILIATGALIIVFARTKEKTTKWEGLICVLCYIAYAAYIVIR